MANSYFYLFEAGAIISFFLILFKERKNKEIFESIILAFVYGLLLEILDAHLSKSYYYGAGFFLKVLNIPLAIAAGWAIIYCAARKMAENYGLKWWQAPFLMAIFALSLDLAIDAAAIRIGFWTWRIPLHEEWFGVPYDNLAGWLAVIWTFAFFINLSRQNFISERGAKMIRYLAVIVSPLLLSLQITLYVSLAAVFSGKFTIGEAIGFYARHDFGYAYYPEVQRAKAYIFIAIVFLLAIYFLKVIGKSKIRANKKFDGLSFFSILAVHSYFFAIMFVEGIYRQIPLIGAIAASMIFFHIFMELFPFRHGIFAKLKI